MSLVYTYVEISFCFGREDHKEFEEKVYKYSEMTLTSGETVGQVVDEILKQVGEEEETGRVIFVGDVDMYNNYRNAVAIPYGVSAEVVWAVWKIVETPVNHLIEEVVS